MNRRLPFEPEAYRRLHGPPCSYVGHPLTEQLSSLRPNADEAARRAESPPVLLVLPGSRRSEIRHHMAVFGQAVARLQEQGVAFELVLPTMPHLQEAVVIARRADQPRPAGLPDAAHRHTRFPSRRAGRVASSGDYGRRGSRRKRHLLARRRRRLRSRPAAWHRRGGSLGDRGTGAAADLGRMNGPRCPPRGARPEVLRPAAGAARTEEQVQGDTVGSAP